MSRDTQKSDETPRATPDQTADTIRIERVRRPLTESLGEAGTSLHDAMETPATRLARVHKAILTLFGHRGVVLALLFVTMGVLAVIEYFTHILVSIARMGAIQIVPGITSSIEGAMTGASSSSKLIALLLIESGIIFSVGVAVVGVLYLRGIPAYEYASREQVALTLRSRGDSERVSSISRSQGLSKQAHRDFYRTAYNDNVRLVPADEIQQSDSVPFPDFDADDWIPVTVSLRLNEDERFASLVGTRSADELLAGEGDIGSPLGSIVSTLSSLPYPAYAQVVVRRNLLGQIYQTIRMHGDRNLLDAITAFISRGSTNDTAVPKYVHLNIRAIAFVPAGEAHNTTTVANSLASIGVPVSKAFPRTDIISTVVGDRSSRNPLTRRIAKRTYAALRDETFEYDAPSIPRLLFSIPRRNIVMSARTVGAYLAHPGTDDADATGAIDATGPDQQPPAASGPDRDERFRADTYDPGQTSADNRFGQSAERDVGDGPGKVTDTAPENESADSWVGDE